MEQLNKLLNEYKIPIGLSLVGLVLIIGGTFSSGILNKSARRAEIKDASSRSDYRIKVDVSGAVQNPAVYSLPSNSRVEDAIKLAGGFAASVSAEYISKRLNLSQKLSDGIKIYVPFEGETSASSGQGYGGVVSGSQTTKIGLNSSTQSQLEALPGVGPATALKIIASRPYGDVSELLSKRVVSRAVYEKIKDLVDVN